MSTKVSVQALLKSTDISDPTDFPPSSILPGLRQLDAALRCDICSELFEAPVTLQCGHCFCSCCVRSTISNKPECPACRKPTNEGHLRVNPAMEEAVSSWKSARGLVLRMSRDELAQLQRTPRKDGTRVRKRKRSADAGRSSSMDIECIAGPSKIRTRDEAKREEDVSDDDFDLPVPTSDPVEEELASPKDHSLIDCPICGRKVRYDGINTHIDKNCPSPISSDADTSHERRSKKSEWSKILGINGNGKGKEKSVNLDELEPLPKASYAVLKDKQLKDLLNEHRLPLTGDRNSWITRHERWVILFNANLDRSPDQRKNLHTLRTDLREWEKEKKFKRNTVKDVIAYQKIHKAEFADLIEAARPKKPLVNNERNKEATGSPLRPVSRAVAEEDIIVLDSEEERLGQGR